MLLASEEKFSALSRNTGKVSQADLAEIIEAMYHSALKDMIVEAESENVSPAEVENSQILSSFFESVEFNAQRVTLSIPITVSRVFSFMDTDRDGKIELPEFKAAEALLATTAEPLFRILTGNGTQISKSEALPVVRELIGACFVFAAMRRECACARRPGLPRACRSG